MPNRDPEKNREYHRKYYQDNKPVKSPVFHRFSKEQMKSHSKEELEFFSRYGKFPFGTELGQYKANKPRSSDMAPSWL